MIPNIAIDNIVEKHVKALALTSKQDWAPGGAKYKEWMKRKQCVFKPLSLFIVINEIFFKGMARRCCGSQKEKPTGDEGCRLDTIISRS
jgi:hypothetical protein